MSWPDRGEDGEPPVPADPQHAPLYRVMIGCGIAGVLIAIGAAVVNFGTGRHSDETVPDAPRFGPQPSAPAWPAPTHGGPISLDATP